MSDYQDMVDKLMKCNQKGCTTPPRKIVHWPGQVPAPRYCIEHAARAIGVLNAMGCPANVEEING